MTFYVLKRKETFQHSGLQLKRNLFFVEKFKKQMRQVTLSIASEINISIFFLAAF